MEKVFEIWEMGDLTLTLQTLTLQPYSPTVLGAEEPQLALSGESPKSQVL